MTEVPARSFLLHGAPLHPHREPSTDLAPTDLAPSSPGAPHREALRLGLQEPRRDRVGGFVCWSTPLSKVFHSKEAELPSADFGEQNHLMI